MSKGSNVLGAIIGHLSGGSVTNHDGKAVEVLADAISRPRKQVEDALRAGIDRGKIQINGSGVPKGYCTTISLVREFVPHTAEGRRQSRWATNAQGDRYKSFLDDDQVGPLSVRQMTEQEKAAHFGSPEPKKVEMTKSKSKSKAPPRKTKDRLNECVSILQQLIGDGELHPINEVKDLVAEEMGVASNSVARCLSSLRVLGVIAISKSGWQGATLISFVKAIEINDRHIKFVAAYKYCNRVSGDEFLGLPRWQRLQLCLLVYQMVADDSGMASAVRKALLADTFGIASQSASMHNGYIRLMGLVSKPEDEPHRSPVFTVDMSAEITAETDLSAIDVRPGNIEAQDQLPLAPQGSDVDEVAEEAAVKADSVSPKVILTAEQFEQLKLRIRTLEEDARAANDRADNFEQRAVDLVLHLQTEQDRAHGQAALIGMLERDEFAKATSAEDLTGLNVDELLAN